MAHQRPLSTSYTACSECAGPCGDAVWEPLKYQTTTLTGFLSGSASTYKLTLLAYKVQITSAHCSLLQPDHNIRSSRSSIAPHFVMPPRRTEIEKRAFRVSAPTAWNALPSAVQLSDSAAGFQRQLKTSFFNCVFNCDVNSNFVSSSSS